MVREDFAEAQPARAEPPARHPRSRYGLEEFLAPAALGLAGALLLPALAGVTPASLGAAALILGAALSLAYRLSGRRHAALEEAPAGPRDDEPHRLRELCVRVLPVWARQIETSRDTADEAVASLARSFSATVEKLEATLAASRRATTDIGAGSASVVGTIARSEANLAGVVAVLKELQQGKDAILGKVGEYAQDLREMAADVQQIALQIRLLSLNGAVEAARAGAAGKPFAVVVGEMQRLSAQSAEVGARISSKALTVNAAVAELFRDNRGASQDEETPIQRAERDIEAVLERFRGLTGALSQSVDVMERESEAVKAQIANALVALQFQDRVSQILSHLAASMIAVDHAVARYAEADMNMESWLAEISRTFTTREEFENLSSARRSTARHTHELTYF